MWRSRSGGILWARAVMRKWPDSVTSYSSTMQATFTAAVANGSGLKQHRMSTASSRPCDASTPPPLRTAGSPWPLEPVLIGRDSVAPGNVADTRPTAQKPARRRVIAGLASDIACRRWPVARQSRNGLPCTGRGKPADRAYCCCRADEGGNHRLVSPTRPESGGPSARSVCFMLCAGSPVRAVCDPSVNSRVRVATRLPVHGFRSTRICTSPI